MSCGLMDDTHRTHESIPRCSNDSGSDNHLHERTFALSAESPELTLIDRHGSDFASMIDSDYLVY
jgi:hypothetical protein